MRDAPTLDFAALADALDEAADTIDYAATELMPSTDLEPIPLSAVQALCALWRLQGRLNGVADALRMVETRDA